MLIKFSGSTVKETVMSRLCTNNVMSFVSMSGRNLGKIAFDLTRLCEIVLGAYTYRILLFKVVYSVACQGPADIVPCTLLTRSGPVGAVAPSASTMTGQVEKYLRQLVPGQAGR